MANQATFLGKPGASFSLVLGSRKLSFKSGETREIPDDALEFLNRQRDKKGTPLFRITESKIVEADHLSESKPKKNKVRAKSKDHQRNLV